MAPKSKAEKKAEKEAEMERLRLEAEAAAEKAAKELAEMEAARAKEEAERQAAEKKLQEELDARVEEQLAAAKEYHATVAHTLAGEISRHSAAKEWQFYLACEELPDVRDEPEVNTYIATWREKPNGTLWETMPDCTSCITLLRNLHHDGVYAFSRGGAALMQHTWQMDAQKQIVAELNRKLDGATAEFLQRSEEFYNKETQSCIVMLPAAGCRYGLWVNLAKNPRMKMIEYPELSITIELPKALALASIGVRVRQYDDDIVSPYASAEARASATMMTLGGILRVDLTSLPQPPKKTKGYTMRMVNEMTHSVVYTEYPIRGADGLLPTSAPPLRISYKLPDTLVLAEGLSPQVGYWESDVQTVGEDGATEDRGSWKTDGISDVQYDAEARTLAFDTLHLTSLTLLQPTHLELPYKRWVFEPNGHAAGDLHVQTQRFQLHFAISARGVSLKAPAIPQTESLISAAPMTAPVLLLRLRACGINLCPKDSDADALDRVTPKDLELEEQVSKELSALLPFYRLSASRWNQSRGPKKCVVKMLVKYGEGMTGYEEAADEDETAEAAAAAATDPFEGIETDWPLMQLTFRRVVLITSNDDHLQCDETPKEETLAQSSALECLKHVKDARLTHHEGPAESSVLYQDTVRQLLNSLRLFSFTKPE